METVKNYYPSKPVIPFISVSVEMGTIIDALKAAPYPAAVKRATYIVVRNESGNGKSVVNGTNPGGVQSDAGQWPSKWDSAIVATCIKQENRTGKMRGFVVFDSLTSGISFMCERLQARGLFVGGTTSKITSMTVKDKESLATAYYREWVTGKATYTPTETEVSDFVNMYKQAEKIFI
jgi:hypothetical protein